MADTLFETRSALRGATIDDDANPAPPEKKPPSVTSVAQIAKIS